MADRHETQQEKQDRWATQRKAHDAQQQTSRAARTRARWRNSVVVVVVVIIVVVIAAIILL